MYFGSGVYDSAMQIVETHNTADLSDPCESDIVKSIVEASKRELNRPIKKTEPLTADLMKLLFLKFLCILALEFMIVLCKLLKSV
jgi:hypothetical protein